MKIDAAPRTRSVPKSAAVKALPPRLVLSIDRTDYVVTPLACGPGVDARRAYRLIKGDGSAYDLAETEHGPQCDCPDYIFRRDGFDPDGCKHVKALVRLGLIGAADMRVEPRLARR